MADEIDDEELEEGQPSLQGALLARPKGGKIFLGPQGPPTLSSADLALPGSPTSTEFKAPESFSELGEAAGAGIARGATFGLSDVLLSAAGGRQKLEQLRQANPLVSGLTEFGGSLASALATGGLTAEGTLAARAATQAGIGAAMGAGGQLSEDVLGDHELNAERYLAAGGMGALLGGGGEYALAGLSAAARPAAERVGKLTQDVTSKFSELAEKWAATPGTKLEGGVESLTKSLQRAMDASEDMARDASISHKRAAREMLKDSPIEPVASGWEQAKAQIADAKAKISEGFKPEDAKAIGKIIDTVDDALSSDSTKTAGEVFQQAREARQQMQKVGRDLERRIASGDTAPSVRTAAQGVSDAVTALKDFTQDSEIFGSAAQRESVMNAAHAERINASKQFLKDFTVKRDGEQLVDGGKVKRFLMDNASGAQRGDWRSTSLGQFLDSLETTGKQADVASSITSAQNEDLARVLTQAVREQSSVGTELAGALREAPSSLRGMVAKTIESVPVIGPVGSRLAENPGEFVATLAKVAGAADRVTKQIARGADEFFSSGKLGGARTATEFLVTKGASGARQLHAEGLADGAERRQKELRQLADPQALSERVADKLGGLQTHAPKIAGILQAKAQQAVGLMTQSFPPRTADPLLPTDEPAKLSAAQIAKLEETYSVLHAPIQIVMSRMATGTLTSSVVSTFRTLNPKLYQQVADTMRQKLIDHGETLSFQHRLQLGVLLGTATVSATRPDRFGALQSGYAQPPAPTTGLAASGRVNSKRVAEMHNPFGGSASAHERRS